MMEHEGGREQLQIIDNCQTLAKSFSAAAHPSFPWPLLTTMLIDVYCFCRFMDEVIKQTF